MSLGELVSGHAARTPLRPAVISDAGQVSYAELDQRSGRLANVLAHHYRVGPGDRVAYLLYNRAEVVELLAGIVKAGAAAVPLNFRLSTAELQGLLEHADPRLLVTEPGLAGTAREAAGNALPLLVLGADYEQLLESASTTATRSRTAQLDDLACIVFTSGTTGLPKGAEFTHRAILAYAGIHNPVCAVDQESRYLVARPHHVSVTDTIVPVLRAGGAIVVAEARAFDGERFLDTVGRHQVTHTELVPTQLHRVLDVPAAGDARMATMRTLAYGGAATAPDRLRELLDRFGSIFVQLYGMTEIAGLATALSKEDHAAAVAGAPRLLSSVGRPAPGCRVRTVDDAGADAPPGQPGEVWFRTPSRMRGYWRNDEQSRAASAADWVRSGDVGAFQGGFLYLLDRKKDMIIRGGQNLSSREIEDVLLLHPAVAEAAVIAGPDPVWGEEVIAVIAVRDAGLTPAAVQEFCAGRSLSRFKIPTRIEFVSELPKNASGKIAKAELRQHYAR